MGKNLPSKKQEESVNHEDRKGHGEAGRSRKQLCVEVHGGGSGHRKPGVPG